MLLITSGEMPRHKPGPRRRGSAAEAFEQRAQAAEDIRQLHVTKIAALAARGWLFSETRVERIGKRVRYTTTATRGPAWQPATGSAAG